jgi:hypothetical protein
MKKFLLTFSSLLLLISGHTQLLMSENFDASTSLPTGWKQYNVDGLTPSTTLTYAGVSGFMGTNGWVIKSKAVGGTDNQAVSTSWYTPSGTSNDWLVTPQITLPASGTYYVEFDANGVDPNYLDGFKVYVSTTGSTVADFTSPAILTVPAAANGFSTYMASLASYAGQNVYVAIQNNSTDKFLLFVDNFKVRLAQSNDAKLLSTSLNRYSLVSTNNTLGLKVKNYGTNPITSLTVNWNDGTDHSQLITGLNIAVGAIATVSHPTPVSYSTVLEKKIAVTITQVNSATDPSMADNLDSTIINTITTSPLKKVIIEEGTGTWCQWCPRGAVAMDYMATTYPDKFIGVAVHNGDPMTLAEYNSGVALTGYPGCNVDRVLLDQDVSKTNFETYYNARKNLPVPASISATASGTGATVSIAVSTTFVTPFTSANFRLGVIMIEDQVRGTAATYNQSNAYANNANGAMGGFEALPNPVPAAKMVYNHVGRALIGGYNGQAGTVPAVITVGQVANYTFNYTVPSTSRRWYMSAIAVLIDNKTGEIVNASKVALSPAGVEEATLETMEVFPNPASGLVNVKFEGKGTDYTVSITDLMGRQVALQSIAKANGSQLVTLPIEGLAAGNYLISVATEGSSSTQNLSIK